jgi:hypothetical protein
MRRIAAHLDECAEKNPLAIVTSEKLLSEGLAFEFHLEALARRAMVFPFGEDLLDARKGM